MTELTGLPPDPDCLHCVLVPVIRKFRDEHPQASVQDIIGSLCQCIGEHLGSALYNSNLRAILPGELRRIEKTVKDTIYELWISLDRMDAEARARRLS